MIMKVFATFAALMMLAGSAFGQAGHWYDPEHPGFGIQINRDSGFGYAVTWYLYRKDGSTAFLTAGETCEQFPCVVALHEPKAGFMGTGDFELGPEIGILEIGKAQDGVLPVEYELIAWVEECRGASPGGIIFQRCIGDLELELIAE